MNNPLKDKYEQEKSAIIHVFNENKGRYGYRRISLILKNKLKFAINHKTVLKLMRELGIQGKQYKNAKYKSYKGQVGNIADNLLNRDFNAKKPFEKLATDITQFNIGGKKVYLSAVMDLYNREIISHTISESPDFKQVRDMLLELFKKLPENATPLFHSDQGWQYQHAIYCKMLKEHGIIQSMSRKGNCLDNSSMENFFSRLKIEMYHGERFENVAVFKQKLYEYIDYYNNSRISLRLNGLSPVEYRSRFNLS